MNTPPVESKTSAGLFTAWVGIRGRGILHTGAWSLTAKICGAANLFVSVPFVLHALGPQQFGAWATLVSLVVLGGFLDFGFGNGIMNLVAAASARGAHQEIAQILHEGMRALLRIGAVVAVAFVAVVALTPWPRLLGLTESDASEPMLAAAIVLGSVAVAIPLGMASRVQLALGLGTQAFRWQALGQLASLATLIALSFAGASLPALTAAAVAPPLLAMTANTIDVANAQRQLRSSATLERDWAVARNIRNEGSMFFVLQLAASFAFAIDLPLISALVGSTEAGQFAIAQRLFSVIPLALSLLWVPLWPVYRQALAKRDHAWVTRTMRKSFILAILASACAGLFLYFLFVPIARLWVPTATVPSSILLAGLACWCVMEAGGTAIGTFLNAASVIRFQVAVSVAFAIACVSAKAWVVSTFGPEFVPWASVATYAGFFAIPTLIFLPGIMRRVRNREY